MIEIFKSKILLEISGKDINRFIKKLIVRKISVLSLKYVNRNKAIILIYKKDYDRVLKIKTIYEILEKDIYGFIKIKKNVKKNRHLIVAIILCIFVFYILTNMVFDIEIIHTNKEIRDLIRSELRENGIKKYAFKKNYEEKERIKGKILNKYPDKIEWLEIIERGTKYIVRVEQRSIVKIKNNNKPRNIVAKKDAVIRKVVANKGVIEKDINDYVKKGDVVINGDVILNEKSKGTVRALGKVYGEVWYVIKTSYPFIYSEEKFTGKKRDVYVIKFLNKDIELSFNKYKNKRVSEKNIFFSQMLPIKFVKQSQREIRVRRWVLTFDEALTNGKKLLIERVKKGLKKKEYIIRSKYLKSSVNNSTIDIEMFFAVYEDITDYKEIE